MNGFENAWRKINEFQKEKPRYICCVGPTGPTGPSSGATGPTGPTGATHPVKSVKYPNF